MLRWSLLRRVGPFVNIDRPPSSGYELSELASPAVLRQFLAANKERLVVCVVHPSTTARIRDNPLAVDLAASLNKHNFGHPSEICFAFLPAALNKPFCEENNILSTPTSLIYKDSDLVDRVVGSRFVELSLKTRLLLRLDERRIFNS